MAYLPSLTTNQPEQDEDEDDPNINTSICNSSIRIVRPKGPTSKDQTNLNRRIEWTKEEATEQYISVKKNYIRIPKGNLDYII